MTGLVMGGSGVGQLRPWTSEFSGLSILDLGSR